MDFTPLEWSFQVLHCLTDSKQRKQDTWVLLKRSCRTGSTLAQDLDLNPGIGELLCATVLFLAASNGLCGNSFVSSVVLLQGGKKSNKWGLVCVEVLVYGTHALEKAIRTYTLPVSLLLPSWENCMQGDGLTQLYAFTISLKQ